MRAFKKHVVQVVIETITNVGTLTRMIGQGVYTLAEVSRYTGVPPMTVRQWFSRRSDGRGDGPLFNSDFDRVDGDYAVSFLNLIESYVARFFRSEGVHSKNIRKAHQKLQGELKTLHPFAHADLRTNGAEIIRKTGDSDLIGAVSKQQFFGQMKLGRMRFNSGSNLAEQWAIQDGVIINPLVNFGKPVIENSGVSTLILANQYAANNRNAALVARLFRINEVGVLNAVAFEESLAKRAA